VPAELPTGTVTLLFTDIEGSTRMLQELGRDTYVRALTEHRQLLRHAFTSHGGVEVEMQGDSFHFAFRYARDAVAAAVAGQRALAGHSWESEPIKVRIGLHTGEPMQADGLYAGLDVHRAARVMSAGHGGQVLMTARTADLVEGELPDRTGIADLGEHRLKDLSAPQRLYGAVIEGLPDRFPPLTTLVNRPTNLPVEANRLIGRGAELAEITDRVRMREHRVLTLTGPGGTGKTRLALHAAAELIDSFDGGVYFVPLASVRDPALVVATVAQTLGVRERPGHTVDELLAEHLAAGERLLLLDNFEHVGDAAGQLAGVLAAAPATSVLVTSRERLRIVGEHVLAVAPLPAPGRGARRDPGGALDNDAVALFVERAREAGVDFELDDLNAGAVMDICTRLDGLPLAIELAAARIAVLSPGAILGRLDRGLALLTSGRRDAEARQRTLRATIEWSYDLLGDDERALFAGLSAFAGGCTLEAAEAVCRADVDTLQSLVDKSLLRSAPVPSGELRFAMLNTIHEYAEERLAENGETEELERQHTEYFLTLAELAEPEVRAAHDRSWASRLETEHDNMRAALSRSLAGNDPDIGLRLACALWGFWRHSGHAAEGRRWLEEALAQRGSQTVTLRAKALRRESVFAWFHGDVEMALAAAEEALTLARELDDPDLIGRSLMQLGVVVLDDSRADAVFEEALLIFAGLGDAERVAYVHGNLGYRALQRGDHGAARARLDECLAGLRRTGDRSGEFWALQNLAFAALLRDEHDVAAGLLEEALRLARELGERDQNAAYCLLGAAAIAAARADWSTAARLLGAEAAIMDAIAARSEPVEDRVRADISAAVEAGLGETFGAEWATGHDVDVETAFATAFEALQLRSGSSS